MPVFLLMNWRWLIPSVVSLGLVVALFFSHAETNKYKALYNHEVAVHQLDIANVKVATERAKAAAEANAKTVEEKQNEVSQQAQADLTSKLAAARTAAADYAHRLQQQSGTAARSVGPADLPKTSNAPTGASGTSSSTELDDATVCAENTVKAQGWQDWYQAAYPAKKP